jgi:beta-glucosidase/6-phospho-beta-glucosidase/beta-galactosidase
MLMFQEDIELIASLGFSAYRFSISWAHIFPGMLNLTDGIRASRYSFM